MGETILLYVLGRLREPSTWVGLGTVITGLNLPVSPTTWGLISQIGITLAGAIAAAVPDRSAGLVKK